MSVERVLKGEAPNLITLVAYVDIFAGPAQRKGLIANARELLFLGKKGDAYAPVQDQYRPHEREWRSACRFVSKGARNLSQTVASIQRLVALQAQAARSDPEAEAAYVDALRGSDIESHLWALWNAKDQARVVSDNAKSMLAMIARQRP